jgi:hypothetical protein
MKLNESQKKHLLAAISEGLETDEINTRAAKHDEPYRVSRQQVDFYRKSRKVKLSEIKAEIESEALRRGFAVKENRVAALDELAQILYDELLEGKRLWLEQIKSIGSGEFQQIIDFEEFNEGEIRQFRGLLDDIAKEQGDRKQKTELTGKDGQPLTVLQVIQKAATDPQPE